MSPADPTLGGIDLNLVGQAPSGEIYRLRDALISVQGPTSSLFFDTEEDPDRTSISADVEPGTYTMTLDVWRLERIDGATATPVTAQLRSDNPATFTVEEGERTTVPLRFEVDEQEVTMTAGYDIVVSVEERSPVLVVATTSQVAAYSLHASGTDAPLRAFTSASNDFELVRGLAVANTFVMLGSGFGSVDYFRTTDVGAVFRSGGIRGTNTRLGAVTSLVVHDHELFVSQQSGSVSVFRLFENGEAPPQRRYTGVPSSCMAVHRDEFYLRGPGASISAYPARTESSPPSPARVITSDTLRPGSAGCLFVKDGEIFVASPEDNAVLVFPATANGAAVPLRVLSGDATTLDGPEQLAVYRGELYVGSRSNRIAVFPASASGNVAPLRTLVVGPDNGSAPRGLVIH